tara:strand:- start:120131 stop:120853 length:723 start_codon:yes stop_codon:yes gene_type:complete
MNQGLKRALIGATTLVAMALPGLANAQEISSVADGIHVIRGQGGNIGVSVGADGVFMIDDQFAPATQAILDQIKTVSDQPVRFLVNTHFHRDHTGGNENLGKSGVLIFARDNVCARLLAGHAPKASLPVVTFNGFYPFIDARSGGSVEGVFAAIDTVLALADDDTVIVHGHGPVGDRADLVAYRDMLTQARDAISPLIADGKSLEAIVAAKPTVAFDADWGGGFLNPERFLRVMHAALTK